MAVAKSRGVEPGELQEEIDNGPILPWSAILLRTDGQLPPVLCSHIFGVGCRHDALRLVINQVYAFKYDSGVGLGLCAANAL